MRYHAIAYLSGGRQKTLPNKSEDELLSQIVLPYVATGIIRAKWGAKTQSYQVLELRVYRTNESWDKRTGPLNEIIKRKQNIFSKFEQQAQLLLSSDKPKVFIITPIQGSKHGDQEEQRILREYDERFSALENVVASHGGVAIRIDRESPLDELVQRIKREILESLFVIADLTDERPSCYFEAGFAEASEKPIIYVASKNSVIKPGNATKVHFDIHMNVNYFTNIRELKEKISNSIKKNHDTLFRDTKNKRGGRIAKPTKKA